MKISGQSPGAIVFPSRGHRVVNSIKSICNSKNKK